MKSLPYDALYCSAAKWRGRMALIPPTGHRLRSYKKEKDMGNSIHGITAGLFGFLLCHHLSRPIIARTETPANLTGEAWLALFFRASGFFVKDDSLSNMSLRVNYFKDKRYAAGCCLTSAESVIVLLASKMSATEDN